MEKGSLRGGIGFASTLTIVFIVLKLLGVINWSWLWVLSPLWISWAILVLVLTVIKLIDKVYRESITHPKRGK